MTAQSAAYKDVFQGGGEMGSLMRALDWGRTPLGPPQTWPSSLHSILRMMLTSRYQMWMAWGQDLTFFCNDAYAPTLGIKRPTALGASAREVWAEIWPDIGPLIDQVLATGEATYSEGMRLFLLRSGFAEETYHTFSYSPLFDDDGVIAGMFCVVVEETDRVINDRRLSTLRNLGAAMAAVRSERELVNAVEGELANNLADLPFTLVYLFDPDEGAPYLAARCGVNPDSAIIQGVLNDESGIWPSRETLSHSAAVFVEALGDHYLDLPSGAWDKPPRSAMVAPIAQPGQASAAGFLVVGLNPYRTADSQYQDFVTLLAGQIAAALGSAHAYEAERRRAEALAEIDRAKTAFFSNVSHEFRTPLTLMLGPLEDVLADAPSPSVRRNVDLAHRNGVRLLRLVNSLLDFSRIEAGRVEGAFAPTDLAAASAEIAASFRSAMERVGLTLTVKAAPLPHPVFLDREMWEKVLLNLLSNAFKFTFEGGVTLEVGPGSSPDLAQVRIKDTGVGVPPAELPRLFERFHRIEATQGRTFEGSGIGLALVQELVKLHGGAITAESEPGQGTTFTIELPYGQAHLPPEQVREGGAADIRISAQGIVTEALLWTDQGERPDGSEPDARPLGASIGEEDAPYVVLADDNSDMRDYVHRLLQGQGYVVDAVGDGEAALAAAQRRVPDLILSDVMMPKLDGFELLRAIRADRSLAGTPVVLLSARAGEEAKLEGLQAGADDYLIKPFAARELLARVAVNIQMARLRREAARAVMQSEQEVLLTQERLQLALSTGRIAIFQFDPALGEATVLGPLTIFFGVAEAQAAHGVPLATFFNGIHEDDRDRVAALIKAAVEQETDYEAEYRLVGGDKPRRVVARGGLQLSADGRKRLVGAVIDLSEEKEAQDSLREQTRVLRTLNQAGSAVAADLDLASLVQTVTNAGVELTKAQFGAFFYNTQNEEGESYRLYALSGAPRSMFENVPMPRNTALFSPTFAGEGVVRSDDITQHPHFGQNAPHFGMPEGHLPVRSYLAMPVKSRSGEVLGALFFGHAEPGVFDQQAEMVMGGLAAQTAVAIDNARLFQAAQREIDQRTKAEAALTVLNSSLEARIAAELAERMAVEEALRQAQKMEAIGHLTGGVAHDFNNLLTVIIGGLDTIRRNVQGDNARLSRALDMAAQGANRAVTLTSRLLAFSRRQPLAPRPLDLNVIVRDSTELLHRTLGETIELEVVLASRLWAVEADQNQLESAILNLAVNARDAMPDGGKLTIETGNAMLDESYAATDSEVVPGQYASISVSDSGEGMSKEVLQRVFEPFYTTKDVGRGTGLGLSMVYGFVKQSGGHVTIYSEPGQGTTVKLYFPRFSGDLGGDTGAVVAAAPESMTDETVLVVEDNEDVRAYSVSILTELGYHVLEAADAEAGLAIARQPGRIDLLFTDVVLPGRSGRALADELAVLRPQTKVLFTTGYSRNAIVHQGRLDAGVNLITKPFSFDQLAQRLRDVLDG